MTQVLSKRVVLLLFFICLNSSHAASQVRDYTLGADLDKYVCYSKLAQLRAPAVNRPGQPLQPGVEHFFASAKLIKLSFRDAPDEIQKKIIEHFRASLRLWYLACGTCPPNWQPSLAFVTNVGLLAVLLLPLRTLTCWLHKSRFNLRPTAPGSTRRSTSCFELSGLPIQGRGGANATACRLAIMSALIRAAPPSRDFAPKR